MRSWTAALILIGVFVGCIGLGPTAAGAMAHTEDRAVAVSEGPASSPCVARLLGRPDPSQQVGGAISPVRRAGSTGSGTPTHGLYRDLVAYWQRTLAGPVPSGC